MRKVHKVFTLFGLASLVLALTGVVAGHEGDPMVKVSDQVVNDGAIWIEMAHSEGPGFVVIHVQKDGSVGPVAGFRWINDGESVNFKVPIDTSMATGTMYAMLHADTGEVGKYEFGTVEGADAPVSGDMAAVNPSFKAEILRAYDQPIVDNTVMVAAVTTQQDGFVVIHDGDRTQVGGVLGFAPVKAGTTTDVAVTLDSMPTGNFVWPMLHVDTGVAGEYEFGKVEGADTPVVINGVVSTFPIVVNAPSMRVNSQLVKDAVWAESVSSVGPGFLVIHADNGGSPGEVIGFAPVNDGVNVGVSVPVDASKLTAVVFPMLHTDTGVVGTYEFGEVEGADTPQMGVDGRPLFYPIMAKPGITYSGKLADGVITVDAALIDVQGWLVIHADNGGKPGPVLGFTPLVRGLSTNIAVTVSADGLTDTVFPMLHVDTGEPGTYEFGQVQGADGPVQTDGNVVTGPMTPAK